MGMAGAMQRANPAHKNVNGRSTMLLWTVIWFNRDLSGAQIRRSHADKRGHTLKPMPQCSYTSHK
jgi:hypothetical protein